MSRLTNNPELKVKAGEEFGKTFQTTIGIMQGDCLSAVLFIYYLAKCLKEEQTQLQEFQLCPKYADDITYVTTSQAKLDEIERDTPPKLKSYNLQVNRSKTEKYQIPRPTPKPYMPELDITKNQSVLWSELDWVANTRLVTPENTSPNWKECKLLGTKLDTRADIKRRKILTSTTMKTLRHIFDSHIISQEIKIRTFNAYAASIFLYNSETWTLTEQLNKSVDSYQRRLLREVLNIRWPRIITNEDLYRRTRVEPWSRTIRRRRLNWLGHVMRLDERTPARTALK